MLAIELEATEKKITCKQILLAWLVEHCGESIKHYVIDSSVYGYGKENYGAYYSPASYHRNFCWVKNDINALHQHGIELEQIVSGSGKVNEWKVRKYFGDNIDQTGTDQLHERLKQIEPPEAIRHKPLAMPKIADVEDGQNLIDLFWIYLRNLEQRINTDIDILDKRDIEDGYKLWNRINKQNLKTRWQECGSKGLMHVNGHSEDITE